MIGPLVFVALGSNLGDRERVLHSAASALQEGGLEIAVRSALYLTEPVGGPGQGWFLNAVVGGDTVASPESLLDLAQAIELRHGRVREKHFGPRTLDVDLLIFGDEQRDTPELVLPHPRLAERRFVLVPLAEIAPQVRHPKLGLTASEMLERCKDRSLVQHFAPWTHA